MLDGVMAGSSDGVVNIRLCQRSDSPPARHRMLTLAEFVAEPLAHDVPVLAGVGIRFVIFEAFVQDLAVPLRDRDLLGSCGDSVPQGLHVLDLLVD